MHERIHLKPARRLGMQVTRVTCVRNQPQLPLVRQPDLADVPHVIRVSPNKTAIRRTRNTRRGLVRQRLCLKLIAIPSFPSLSLVLLFLYKRHHEHHQAAKVSWVVLFHASPTASTIANKTLRTENTPSSSRARSLACRMLSANSTLTIKAISTRRRSSRRPNSQSTSRTMWCARR